MLKEVLGTPLCLELFNSLPDRQSVGLSEEVRHELLVGADGLTGEHDGCLRLGEADELRRNHAALVHQLVEAVLAIRAGLTENQRTSFNIFVKSGALESDSLSIAFHVELLDVCREPY